ncbi:MAG: hemerythrin family protein [Victivallaceae bacterium]|nr:hemerythrin family protein [Victivallaceae bacterium]
MNINREPFMTGIKRLDEQHNTLFDLVEDILKACLKQDISNTGIREEMDKAINYTAEHFAEEEKLMRSINYPFSEEHQMEHNLFRKRLDTMREELNQPAEINYVDYQLRLGKWLMHWFGNHVHNDDMKLARFINEN